MSIPPIYSCEAEVADGLEDIAFDEISKITKTSDLQSNKGAVQFSFQGNLTKLMTLKTVIAVYIVQRFDISRPKALLGHQNFHILLDTIDAMRHGFPYNTFRTLSISAAGSNSSVMVRLKRELATHLNMEIASDVGDLFIRIRKSRGKWEVLIRTTPRPLATREWRVCNMEGALNGPVACAMVSLLPVKEDNILLNLGCGSGTLMIEAQSMNPQLQIIGCDNNVEALKCAQFNIASADYDNIFKLMLADMVNLPLKDNVVDYICADLPFGQLVGSHQENEDLYPNVLGEAARIIKTNGLFIVITHEIRLMEKTLEQSSDWKIEKLIKIMLSGLHPRIYLLRKI